jgi:DNA-binding GntR family transcriptional regulator
MAANPLYYRIQRDISESITAGEYLPGSRIPSEAALADWTLSVGNVSGMTAMQQFARVIARLA